jgi:hypothetical protein
MGSREGWELYEYILTGSHPSQLPTTLGTYLSRIMFDSLMMAF